MCYLVTDLVLELVITLRWYGQEHTKLAAVIALTEEQDLSKNLLFVIMEMLEIC